MSIIKSVSIEGVWGDSNFNFTHAFNKDVNILIGPNGSGKTTVIQLIAAALDVDVRSLAGVEFSKIDIVLFDASARRQPSITIIKATTEIKSSSNYALEMEYIKYIIKETSKSKPKEVIIEINDRSYYDPRRKNFRLIETRNIIKRLVSHSWLTVNRYKLGVNQDRYSDFASPVDKKLNQLLEDLYKHFAALEVRDRAEKNLFLQKMFLLMLDIRTKKFFNKFAKNVNLEDIQEELVNIFSAFEMPNSTFSKHMDKFFNSADVSIKKLVEGNPITLEQINSVLSVWRVDSIVEIWKKYIESSDVIYRARREFITILNEMYKGKRVVIRDNKEISAQLSDGKCITPKDFSSGEKQLFIILGEALLQDEKRFVFIADEPELSLHVKWQDELIKNIKRINPSAQILFATHSPDIVSVYNNKKYVVGVQE